MFELTGNVRQTRDSRAPAPKLREDGTNYPYRMFFDENARIVDADTLGELIEQLIPGYLEFSEGEKSVVRKQYAERVAFHLRVSVLGELTAEEEEKLSDWEWNVLSSDEPIKDVYPLGSVDDPDDEIKFWSSDVPLVLVEEDYHPFTDVLPPVSSFGDAKYVSNLIWVRSSTEEALLDSLNHVGLIVYGSPRVQPTDALR